MSDKGTVLLSLLRLLKDEGLSVQQIERLTGINRGVVLKASVVKRTVPLTCTQINKGGKDEKNYYNHSLYNYNDWMW